MAKKKTASIVGTWHIYEMEQWKDGDTERFEFTWEGNDECDEASGSGWLRLKSADEVEGNIKLHYGDRSGFAARRA